MRSARFPIDYETQAIDLEQGLVDDSWCPDDVCVQDNAPPTSNGSIHKKSYLYRARNCYNENKVKRYQNRKPARHRAEMRLVARAFAGIPKSHRVLDVPCGWGRITLMLTQAGYQVGGADLSLPMLEAARSLLAQHNVTCAIEEQDIERLTYPDRSFDSIICFRLFHHFPYRGLREDVVRELCRVADRYVLLSYLSPLSITSCRRYLSQLLFGRKFHIFSSSLGEIKGYFEPNGFRLVKDFAQLPYLHTLHLALFERSQEKG